MNQFGRIIPIGIGLAMCVSIVVAFYVPQNGTIPKKRDARNAIDSDDKWTDGVIPYIFEDDIPDEVKVNFLYYMGKLEEMTDKCISFREKEDSDTSFIITDHTKVDGCEALVGKSIDQPQTISLCEGCENQGAFFHAILHVIGFNHEHSRPDREKYVAVNMNHIEDGKSDNFEVSEDLDVRLLDLPYDYYSIMHYDRNTFPLYKTIPTIVILDPNVEADLIGRSEVLSLLDILKVKTYYNCIEPTTNTLEITMKEIRSQSVVFVNSDKLVTDSKALEKLTIEQQKLSLLFDISFNDYSTVCLKSLLNHKYVSVDANGFLTANSDDCVSDSARFYMPRFRHGFYMLRSKANLQYIRRDGSLSLKANAQSRSSAALFSVQVSK